MEYKVEKAEKSTVKISITLNHEEWEAAQEAAYNKTKGKYSLPGFRKGKVPMKMLENAYGKGIFYEDADQRVLPQILLRNSGKGALRRGGLRTRSRYRRFFGRRHHLRRDRGRQARSENRRVYGYIFCENRV